MSEMVERVARAICGDPNDDGRNVLEVHRQRARLAIAAMREPTEAMVEAGVRLGCPEGGGGDITASEATDTWQKMIDEALKP